MARRGGAYRRYAARWRAEKGNGVVKGHRRGGTAAQVSGEAAQTARGVGQRRGGRRREAQGSGEGARGEGQRRGWKVIGEAARGAGRRRGGAGQRRGGV